MTGADAIPQLAGDTPIAVISGVNALLVLAMTIMAVRLRIEAQLPLQKRSLSWLIVACALLAAAVVLTGAGLMRADLVLISAGGAALAVFLSAGLVALYFAFGSTRHEAAVLSEQVKTDDLTGLRNRRGFYELGKRAVADAAANGRGVAVLFLDLDDFKAYNDTHGHEAGDRLLRDAGRMLQSWVRAGDLVARYGGEEFVVLLNASPEAALLAAERLRRLFESQTASAGMITVSIGLAALGDKLATLEDLIAEADRQLYRAKRAGKNRTAAAAIEIH